MISLFGRMIRRYAVLLLLTTLTGSLSVSDRPAAAALRYRHPAASSSSQSHQDAPATPMAGASMLPGHVLVRAAAAPAARTVLGILLRSFGARTHRVLAPIGWTEVIVPGSATAAVRALRASGFEAEPVWRGRVATSAPTSAPAEACFGGSCPAEQWHLAAIAAPYGAALVGPGPRVRVAVLDTRIDRTHPDWVPAGATGPSTSQGGPLEASRDYVTNHTGSAAYHGTFVAGLIAAAINGRDGAGVAPERVSILPMSVVDGGGMTDAATLATAILDAWRAGARVINLSLGITADSTPVHDAIRLVTRGDASTPATLVVAAAGNNSGSAPFYPGSYAEVLSVSGTAVDDRAASCSNRNGNVAVAAPADRLIGLSVMPQRMLQAPCGTSAAAPQVSALAALLLAQDPSRSPAQVRQLIVGSADDLGQPGRDDAFGAGRINVHRSLLAGTLSSGARIASTPRIVSGRDRSIVVEFDAIASRGPVRGAEGALADPAAASILFAASDGRFDAVRERVRATVSLTGLPPGVHRLFIRVRDDAGLGAATPVVIVIDATAPTVTALDAPTSVRAMSPLVITFQATDAYSEQVTYAVELVSTATGQRALSGVATRPGGAQRLEWTLPASLAPGHYRVVLGVTDQSGNPTRVEAGTVLG